MNLLPPPSLIGLPEGKFRHWRPGQDQAICKILDSSRRFIGINAPCGFGKTPAVVGAAVLGQMRTAFLTSQRALETQMMTDFNECGLIDIRGQQNYLCRALQPSGIYYNQGIRSGDRCDAGPCHAGAPCSARKSGCDYFDAVRTAQQSPMVVSNYSYWIAQHRYSEGLGRFDMLVLDEAHDAPDELGRSIEAELFEYDLQMATGAVLIVGEDVAEWKRWAQQLYAVISPKVARLDDLIRTSREFGQHISPSTFKEFHFLKNVQAKIGVMASMEGSWMVERRPKSVRVAPVWPSAYAESHLFLKIPKIVFISGTLKEKTLELLGIRRDDFEYHEYPSTFPPHRRPIRHIPSIRCHHKNSDVEQKTWVRRMDQVIARRLDRKGIIHTTSYDRRNLILTYSEHRSLMLYNDGSNTRQIVEKFRRAEPPAILVSPSLTTGWDLPYDACEYAIIGKIPFPDTRSRITKARTDADEEYSPYQAMQTIVQAAGRGMRSRDDQCEILVLDDNWSWFWPKFRKFAPRWFQEAVDRRRYDQTIPDPLPKLIPQGETDDE